MVWTVLVLVWLAAPAAAAWEPARDAAAEQTERLARWIVERSVLGNDLEPLLQSLPSWFTGSARKTEKTRRRLAERRQLLLARLGGVRDWSTAEVLQDPRGFVKVKVRFYETPPGRGGKRPFRGLSFLFVRDDGRWTVQWVGFWDPESGSWNVLSDDPPPPESGS